MKTVKIPTCESPFVVYVNGEKYSYPAGTEQEVPDEVAILIEQHEAYHEEKDRIAREGDGSQGGGTGGGYTTCKVHISSEASDFRVICSALGDNGKPTYSETDYSSNGEYDFDVVCGSLMCVMDTGMQSFIVQSELQQQGLEYASLFFVPADAKEANITISW